MRGGQQGAETFTGVIAFVVGLFLLITGVPGGSTRNVLLGVAFALQGAISIAAPRFLPPSPGSSVERARARRVMVTVLPTGVVYIVVALLLLTILPNRERTGVTTLIAVVLLVLGALNVFSGLGARARMQRPDPPQTVELRDETVE